MLYAPTPNGTKLVKRFTVLYWLQLPGESFDMKRQRNSDLLLGDLLASLAILDLGSGIVGVKVQYDGAVIAYGGGKFGLVLLSL